MLPLVVVYYHLIFGPYPRFNTCPGMGFVTEGSHFAFGGCIPLVPFHLEQFPHLSLVFVTLKLLKILNQWFSKMSPNLGLFDVYLWWYSGYTYHRINGVFSESLDRLLIISLCPIIGDIHVDYLTKVLSTRLLLCVIIIFSFVINKCFMVWCFKNYVTVTFLGIFKVFTYFFLYGLSFPILYNGL